MSFKIKQNGIVKDLKLPASSIQLLDMDDNYTTNNLEEVLQELGESDSIYISDNEPDKDGVWISNENIAQTGENKTFNALKDYIEGNVTPKINQLSNPNLLINSDFRNPVNQRGKTIYDKNGEYTIDKWLFNNDGNGSLTINDGYISISNGVANNTFIQYWYDENMKALEGKKVTFTIMYKSTATYRLNSFIESAELIGNIYMTPTNDWTIKTLTVDLSNWKYDKNKAGSSIILQSYDGESFTNGILDIKYVKLELGSQATPFIPKPYVQELQDCLMYDGDKLATPYSNPNLLINGDFQIWQRGTSFNTHGYTSDRWRLLSGNSTGETIKTTMTQGTPDNAMQIHPTTICNLWQVIENTNWLSGKTVTLSFDAYANRELGYHVCLVDGNEYDGNPQVGIQWITLTTQRKRYSLTFKLPTLTSNKLCVVLYRASTDITIKFANVKLELGSIATPFVSRPYAEELAMCQRYYEKSSDDIIIPGFRGHEFYELEWQFEINKRIPPTISYGNNGSSQGQLYLVAPNWLGHTPVPITPSSDTNRTRFRISVIGGENSPAGTSVNATGWFIADSEIY